MEHYKELAKSTLELIRKSLQKLNQDKLPNLPANLNDPNNINQNDDLLDGVDMMNHHMPLHGQLNRNENNYPFLDNHRDGSMNLLDHLKNQNILDINKHGLSNNVPAKIYTQQCEFLNEPKADSSEIDVKYSHETLYFFLAGGD